jgi:hypothetical protein
LRLVLFEQARQAFEGLGAGIAADAAIDHRQPVFCASSVGQASPRLHAVRRGQAVAQGQHLAARFGDDRGSQQA